MEKRKVVLLKADGYNLDFLKQRIKNALESHFSLDNITNAGKVLLKPNLLMPIHPDYAITTHPVFIEAVGSIFKEKGLDVYIADNPSIFNTDNSVDKVYKETQIKNLAKRCGFNLLYPSSSYTLEGIPFSGWSRDFMIVNLPKFKTHNITTITCAVKNLYGCISGAYKSRLHKLYPKTKSFINVLLKLYKMIKPVFNIVDGVVSLEGEGPATGGTPRRTGFVAIGDDALCVDYAVSEIIGLPKDKNPLINLAETRGYFSSGDVEVISDGESLSISNFKLPSGFFVNSIPELAIRVLGHFIKIYPRVDKNICTGCGDCTRICPSGAITIEKNKAFIDYSKCISCMCCFEVCRFKAIDVRKSLLLKIKSFL